MRNHQLKVKQLSTEKGIWGDNTQRYPSTLSTLSHDCNINKPPQLKQVLDALEAKKINVGSRRLSEFSWNRQTRASPGDHLPNMATERKLLRRNDFLVKSRVWHQTGLSMNGWRHSSSYQSGESASALNQESFPSTINGSLDELQEPPPTMIAKSYANHTNVPLPPPPSPVRKGREGPQHRCAWNLGTGSWLRVSTSSINTQVCLQPQLWT